MKTTITIEFTGADAEAVADLTRGVDLGTLIRDAFGEFVASRGGPVAAAEYVATRYAEQNERFRAFKLREVTRRKCLAEVIKRGDVTIIVGSE